MKVLIADDDGSVRESLRKVLEEMDYEVLLAADGQEALEHFEKEDIDLLLLDIGMPITNGWDAFERITNQNPVLPIIVITGQSDQYETALAAGVGALMEKPLDVSQLLKTMMELLRETKETRLRRLCGYNRDTRHVPSSSALLLQELRERYSASFRSRPLEKLRA